MGATQAIEPEEHGVYSPGRGGGRLFIPQTLGCYTPAWGRQCLGDRGADVRVQETETTNTEAILSHVRGIKRGSDASLSPHGTQTGTGRQTTAPGTVHQVEGSAEAGALRPECAPLLPG